MSLDSLLALGRISERMLIVLFAGLALWMGWKLFYKRLDQIDQTEQTAEFSFKDVVVKLQKVAPGVMFAFFGAAVLGIALWKNVEVTGAVDNRSTISEDKPPKPPDTPPNRRKWSYLGANDGETEKQVQSLNLAVSLAAMPVNFNIPAAERDRFNKSATNLELLRNDIVKLLVGADKFAIWMRWNAAYQRKKEDVPADERRIVEEVLKLMQDTGG